MEYYPFSFDYEQLLEKPLKRVMGIDAHFDNYGGCSFYEIVFEFEDACIHVSVNDDTDEVIVTAHDERFLDRFDKSRILPVKCLDQFIGKALEWLWSGTNCRGYNDVFMISFSEGSLNLHPDIILIGEASFIVILLTKQITGAHLPLPS